MFSAGGEIRTREPLRDRILSPDQRRIEIEKNRFIFSESDIQEFLNRLKASGRSDLRIQELKNGLKRFGETVNWDCKLTDITEYIDNRRKEVSNVTLTKDIQMIKQFLKDQNIEWGKKIKRPTIERKKPKIVNKEDIIQLINKLKEVDVEQKYFYRAKTAIILSAVSGMRPWEIYRLNWEDIDLENRIINLPAKKTKTREERTVIFNKEAQTHLKNHKKNFPNQAFNKKTIYTLTNKINPKPETKLKHCRKYFSQQWDRQGLPTSIKEMLMGHFGTIDLTNYNNQTPENLKKIYDKANLKITEQ
ncbi:XerD/XerC family integrase [Methanonatronarchaeum thermophilum]|uniref:XerD/XerC family integrase n=1 Tax=Methanonatronarchaeum thermophilum TaxID=1927129 RepID=A0A1Y3GGL5_9EURY|nr:site-specific integrase [Methanonatronarchaeum thermophilum]OUJ19344.1 XerD/XerC family integrase [Methanonatronarchaeum thermophilum]